MSNLIAKLHQHKLHNVAHYQPYLERYHKNDFTSLDHYRHLRQILPIYEALEKKIAHESFLPTIPLNLQFFLHRSEEIKKDLAFLEEHIPVKYRNEELPTTQKYAEQLENLDPTATEGQQEIFSHFLIRILGDLFGGQGLKKCAIDAYKRESIYNFEILELGTQFYEFPKNALNDFKSWLTNLELTNEYKNEIVRIADDAYQKHIDIFVELESTRTSPILNSIYAAAQYSMSFFTCKNITAAVTVAGLGMVAACTISNTLNG